MITVPREAYHDDLLALRDAVEEMGERVLAQLADALEALAATDEPLARSVLEGDDAINDRYLAIEADCIDLFALQQPVAGDLRFVAAAFKIITDLERVGDLATNLARYTLATDRDRGWGVDVREIGRLAQEQLTDALETFVHSAVVAGPVPATGSAGTPGDAAGEATEEVPTDVSAACRAIADRDDEIDVLCQRGSESLVRDCIERSAGEGTAWDLERVLDDVTRLLLTIRDLERVGDHAVNIAARTLYMAENDASLVY